MRGVYIAVVAASVGVFAGYHLGERSGSRAVERKPDAETANVLAKETREGGAIDADALVRAVRAAVRSELVAIDDELKQLQAAFEEAQGTCGEVEREDGPQVAATNREAQVPTPEQERSLEDMRSLVSDALSSGTWGERERSQYREVAGKVPFEEFVEEQRRLIVAINRGDVRVLTDGMPF
jgi:hypothetical protein